MQKSDLRVDLLGTSFSVTVDENPVYLKNLLVRFRRKIEDTQQATGITDPLKSAILAGFLLCDENEKLRTGAATGENVLESQAAEELTEKLIKLMDAAIPKQKE